MNGAAVNGKAANGAPQQDTLPGWGIALIAVGGAGVLGTGGFFGWRAIRKFKAPKS